ncbi:hypothetical protein IQ273_05885 [Nodosilinea sp. LEGE 07298]|uniref:hypothetical protein n=1 Tax=Nodosilinea sp. LEGE 07298 TaxID=2777970 RepID=UPI001881D425|nr:hypothetical protein [Nodosilinea sp. LEGE 07298]MBE9108946.1 hypothetical protein [Nodosilinea sp. LEGE 07298]
MRVWALASCSGLLALAACSAEQSSPPDLGTAPPDGDDAVEVNAQPGLRATSSSPMARPELPSRQGGLDRARFSPRSQQSGPQASRASSAGQTLPQADQLRERLQRLRAQHGSRLSSNTPIATAPLPAALTSTPPRPVPQEVAEQPSETRPIDNAIATPGLEPSLRPVGVTALPTPPRPNVAAPELGLSSTASTAIDLGPVASGSLAPVQHQGYSTRSQRPAPTITTAAPESSGGLTARLHGATPISPSGSPATVAAAQPSPPATAELPAAAAPAPAQAESAPESGPEASPLATTAVAVGAAPAGADPGPAIAHQSSATPALTLTPQPVEASVPPTLARHSQGIAARPETAIAPWGRSATTAPPESLPLNQGTPRLSPLRPAAAATPPDATSAVPQVTPQAWEARSTEVQASETGVSEIQTPEVQIPAAQTPGSAFSAHQGQSQLESLSLRPQPKDLPAAYCLQASGLPLSSETQLEFDPQRANPQLDQLSTAIRLGAADAALAREGRLSKAETAAACLEESRAAAEPAADGADSELTWDEALD